jgi:hypothetical protein
MAALDWSQCAAIIPGDSPSCYDSAGGNLLGLSILWFAKAAAETPNGAVLGRVVPLRLSPR